MKTYHGEPPVRDPELGVGALPVEPEHGVEVGARSRSFLLVMDAAAVTGSHVGWRRRARAQRLLLCATALFERRAGVAEWRAGENRRGPARSKQTGAREETREARRGRSRKLLGWAALPRETRRLQNRDLITPTPASLWFKIKDEKCVVTSPVN